MQTYKLTVEILQKGAYESNDYRLFVNDELFLERPYNLPDYCSHQKVHIDVLLNKGPNAINLQNLTGNVFLGKININNKEIQHTNGYFEL